MIDPVLFLAQAINFLVLVGLLYKLLYKPVREFMDKRTAEIEGNIKSAEENKLAAEKMQAELEEQLNDGRKQARQFLDDAMQRAEVLQSELIAEAKTEADNIIQRAQEEVRLEKEKTWAELQKRTGELSLLLASKVVQESLDEKKHQELIEQTIVDLNTLNSEGSQ